MALAYFATCYPTLVCTTHRNICVNLGLCKECTIVTMHIHYVHAIQLIFALLALISVSIHHMKGYQDQCKLKQPLTNFTFFNVDCDLCMASALTTPLSAYPMQHPMIPTGMPTSKSNNKPSSNTSSTGSEMLPPCRLPPVPHQEVQVDNGDRTRYPVVHITASLQPFHSHWTPLPQ